MSTKPPIKEVLKVQQPTLAVEAEHVDVIQAPKQDEVLRIKQPLSAAEDANVLTTAGQRRINFIWEITQSIISIAVAIVTLYVAGTLALRTDDNGSQTTAFILLSNVFFVVISTYIQRTNHQKIGGVKTGDTGR